MNLSPPIIKGSLALLLATPAAHADPYHDMGAEVYCGSHAPVTGSACARMCKMFVT
ncbi:hypothetical protein [Acinetobacter sp. BY419]|uniref:hypothetical protein n=1 Tax=Acinetobacter sp. BY419 TaxID=2820675 RepID=UPI001C23D61B|nr:hypothetical protein [Acinetobacter sp. BY419]